MIEYIKELDWMKHSPAKDKRYYTFDVKFAEYYSYLETMLNTLWIKMGLGMEDQSTFNIFSFFNISKDGKDFGSNWEKVLFYHNMESHQ